MSIKYTISLMCIALALPGLFACRARDDGADSRSYLTIVRLQGQVETKTGDALPRKARVGMRLREFSRVITEGKNSVCDMVSPSGTVVRVMGNTTLALRTLYHNKRLRIERSRLRLILGKILVKAKKLADKQDFEVETASVVAGVRGTQFIVSHDPDQGTRVAVRQGKVSVRRRVRVRLPQAHQNIEDNLNDSLAAYYTTTVSSNQQLTVPPDEVQTLARNLEQSLTETIDRTGPQPEKEMLQLLQKTSKKQAASNPPSLEHVDPDDPRVSSEFKELSQMRGPLSDEERGVSSTQTIRSNQAARGTSNSTMSKPNPPQEGSGEKTSPVPTRQPVRPLPKKVPDERTGQ